MGVFLLGRYPCRAGGGGDRLGLRLGDDVRVAGVDERLEVEGRVRQVHRLAGRLVQCFGFQVSGLGFGILCLGFKVKGLGLRVWGLGFRVKDFGL